MSGIIKTIKAKDDNNIQHNIFPKTVLEAVVDSETNETLDNILADKVSKTDVVDNLLSTATDLPLSANQGRVLRNDVDFLGSKWLIQTTSVKGTVTFTLNTYVTSLLFCQWGGAPFYAIYYIDMHNGVVAPISSNSDAWTVTISDNNTKLNISNENGGNQWANYRLLMIS